jgi:hypothetical protein
LLVRRDPVNSAGLDIDAEQVAVAIEGWALQEARALTVRAFGEVIRDAGEDLGLVRLWLWPD